MKSGLLNKIAGSEALLIGGLLAFACITFSSKSHAEIYKCTENGEVVFSNQSSSVKQKNCIRVRPQTVPRAQTSFDLPTSKVGRAPADVSKPQVTNVPSGFPRVDPGIQKSRDDDRAAILDEERRKESSVLSELKREFNNGVPERRSDERDQQKYVDRIEKLKQGILRAETNVRSLERELKSVR